MGPLRTAATVAVASSVHGRVQRRQQARWAAQGQQGAARQAQQPPPPQHQAPADRPNPTPPRSGSPTSPSLAS